MCVKQSLQLHSHQMVSTQRWKLLLTAAGAALCTSVAFKATLFRWFHFALDTAWEAMPQTGWKRAYVGFACARVCNKHCHSSLARRRAFKQVGRDAHCRKACLMGRFRNWIFFLFVLVHHEGIHVSHDRFLMPQLQHPAKTILLPYEGSIQSYIGWGLDTLISCFKGHL